VAGFVTRFFIFSLGVDIYLIRLYINHVSTQEKRAMAIRIGKANISVKDLYGATLTVEKCDQIVSLIREAKYPGWKDHIRDFEALKDCAKRGIPQTVKPMSVQFVAINRLVANQVDVEFLMDGNSGDSQEQEQG